MKILLVDDSPDIIAVLKKLLSKHIDNLEILEGRDGTAAIEAHERHKDIDVTIIDKHMPGMNGDDAIVHIRKYINVRAEFILLTAYRDDAENELKLGAEHLKGPTVIMLSKPPSGQSLADLVKVLAMQMEDL